MRTHFGELQQQNLSIGRVKILLSARQDENEIQTYLDLEEKRRAVDKSIVSNEKLRGYTIGKGKDVEQ